MTKEEKDVLQKIINTGEISTETTMEAKERKLLPILVSHGYLEERDREVQAGARQGGKRVITFYRATVKGHSVFYPLHKRLWFKFGMDVRTVVVSSVTALVTTIIALMINRFF